MPEVLESELSNRDIPLDYVLSKLDKGEDAVQLKAKLQRYAINIDNSYFAHRNRKPVDM